jgi:hypothetical protein
VRIGSASRRYFPIVLRLTPSSRATCRTLWPSRKHLVPYHVHLFHSQHPRPSGPSARLAEV